MVKKNAKKKGRGAKKGQPRTPMTPRTEEELKTTINVLLVRTIKLFDQFSAMSKKRIYNDIATEIKQKSFAGSMEILRTHLERTESKIFGTEDMQMIDINDYLRKTEEDEQENEE